MNSLVEENRTKYRLEEINEYPFYIIELEVTDIFLLEKLDGVIKKTINEYYYGDATD